MIFIYLFIVILLKYVNVFQMLWEVQFFFFSIAEIAMKNICKTFAMI